MLKENFPILNKKVNKNNLIYLDNASTTQKPNSVIDKINNYYNSTNSNIHRGVHTLSQKATDEYEKSRHRVQKFISAKNTDEIIFVKGTTEGINLVANSYVKPLLAKGDNIVISQMEHHANIVPWQIICEEKKAEIKIIPMNKNGELKIEKLKNMINSNTKFISINHVSNTLGTINPIKDVIAIAPTVINKLRAPFFVCLPNPENQIINGNRI